MSSLSNSLAYLEDYLDTFEALPLEVTRQLTMIRELDANCHELLANVSRETPAFIEKLATMKSADKKQEMLRLMGSYKKLIADGQEKVQMAIHTYDVVERHIRRLDEDLVKFEEEQMTGPKLVSSKPDQKYYREEASQKPNASTSNTTTANRPKRVLDTPRKRKGEELEREDSPVTNPSRPPPRTFVPPPAPVAAAASTATISTTAAVNATTSNVPAAVAPSSSATVAPANSNPATASSEAAASSDQGAQKKGNTPRNISGTSNTGGAGSTSRKTEPPPKEVEVAPEDNVIVETEVDPNEPTYCVCNRVSFGEMIACDNDDCPREWFHYTCVGLEGPVKGKWYCPACRS